MRKFLEWANKQLAKLPTVPFKVVQLAVLDALTLGWGVTMSFVKDSADGVPTFNAWLYFLASLHGINLGAFITAKVKGATNAPLPPDTPEDAVPAAAPVAAVPVAVTQTTTSTTVTPGVSQ